MWSYLFIIGVFHIFIDKGKLVFTEKLGLKGENLFFLLVDQFFHIGFLWIICRFGVGERIEGLSIPIYGNSYIWKWVAGYLVTTYGATILIWSARSTLFSKEKPSLPPLPSKLLEFWERILVTTGFFLGSFYYLLIPLGILPRSFLLFRGEKKISWIDLFLSFLMAIGVGVWLRSL